MTGCELSVQPVVMRREEVSHVDHVRLLCSTESGEDTEGVRGSSSVTSNYRRGRRNVSGELIRVVWKHRRNEWWRHVPFLPVPSRSHLEWRIQTAYGRVRLPALSDLRAYLRWHRAERRSTS